MSSSLIEDLQLPIYTEDDAPRIRSKFLSILDSEADRISALPLAQRKPADIKTSIACIQALTAMYKDSRAELEEVIAEVKPLSPDKLSSIVNNQYKARRKD